MHSGSRRFEFGNHGVITIPPDHLIGYRVNVHLMLGELGMSPRYSRRRVGDEEHAYVGVGRYHSGDVSSLSDDAVDCLGDQLLLPGDEISTNIQIGGDCADSGRHLRSPDRFGDIDAIDRNRRR